MINILVTPEKLTKAGGFRYKNARRTELYRDIMAEPHTSRRDVAWLGRKDG